MSTRHEPQIDTTRTIEGTMHRPGCLCGWSMDVLASDREAALEVLRHQHPEALNGQQKEGE